MQSIVHIAWKEYTYYFASIQINQNNFIRYEELKRMNKNSAKKGVGGGPLKMLGKLEWEIRARGGLNTK